MEKTHDGAVLELQTVGRPYWNSSRRTVSHERDFTLEQGKRVEEEKPRQTIMDQELSLGRT